MDPFAISSASGYIYLLRLYLFILFCKAKNRVLWGDDQDL